MKAMFIDSTLWNCATKRIKTGPDSWRTERVFTLHQPQLPDSLVVTCSDTGDSSTYLPTSNHPTHRAYYDSRGVGVFVRLHGAPDLPASAHFERADPQNPEFHRVRMMVGRMADRAYRRIARDILESRRCDDAFGFHATDDRLDDELDRISTLVYARIAAFFDIEPEDVQLADYNYAMAQA